MTTIFQKMCWAAGGLAALELAALGFGGTAHALLPGEGAASAPSAYATSVATPQNPFETPTTPGNPFEATPENPYASPPAAPTGATPSTAPAPSRAPAAPATRSRSRGRGAAAHALDLFLSDDSADPISHIPDAGAETEAPLLLDEPVADELAEEPAALPAPEAPRHVARTRPSPRMHVPAANEPSRLEAILAAPATARTVTPEPARSETETVRVAEPTHRSPADTRSMAHLAADAAAETAPASDDGAMSALDEALSAGRPEIPVAPTPAVPDVAAEPSGVPSRAEVQAVISEVTPTIRACVDGLPGRVVAVRTTFAPNGRATTAVIEASHTPISASQRSCMARAARGARMPAFERERFEITYPVRL